ncbi:MAG: hypothetical protein FWE70_01045 [Oscillospiraceae bacterium]|nr:hypothetical protein [Oscillospiraceae bacterium]
MGAESEWTEKVRIYRIPDCKMVTSGDGLMGQGSFTLFHEWFSRQTVFPIYSFDFLREGDEPGTLNWNYVHDDRMDVPDGLEVVDFMGGYYAVVTGRDGADTAALHGIVDEYLDRHRLEIDGSRPSFGHILSGYELIKETLGKGQMDYWFPIRRSDA